MRTSKHPQWRKSQQKAVTLTGCKETPGGGSRPGYPSDGTSDTLGQEHKYTSKDYIVLQVDWLEKICREALLQNGRTPVLTFEVGTHGVWKLEPVWALVDVADQLTKVFVVGDSVTLYGETLKGFADGTLFCFEKKRNEEWRLTKLTPPKRMR